jgi:MoxR-like ATPase
MRYGTFAGNNSTFYEVDSEVAEVVNFAIKLGRPILVEGEAGCGKTTLARAIAEELGIRKRISVTVKSSFQAKDLLYRFNALRRLQDIQDPRRPPDAQYVYPYITLEPLGEAILKSEPAVVLIDEIDKADIDFPNDLLQVLDQFAFDIDDLPQEEDALCQKKREFGRRVAGGETRPIVVITSNREKQLPEPFLRRCFYIELRFPDNAQVLKNIVSKNLGGLVTEELLDAGITRFLELRQEMLESGAQKPPATSELIDWLAVLMGEKKSSADLQGDPLLYWKLLLKTMQDVKTYAAKHPRTLS